MIGDVKKLGNVALVESDLYSGDLAIQLDFDTNVYGGDNTNRALAVALGSMLQLRNNSSFVPELKSSSSIRLSANGILSIYICHEAVDEKEPDQIKDIDEVARLLLHRCNKLISGGFCARNFEQDMNDAAISAISELSELRPTLSQLACYDTPVTSENINLYARRRGDVRKFSEDVLNYGNCLASVYCNVGGDNDKSSRLLQMIDDILRSMLQGESTATGEVRVNPVRSQVIVIDDYQHTHFGDVAQFHYSSFTEIGCTVSDIALSLVVNDAFRRIWSNQPHYENFHCNKSPLLTIKYGMLYLCLEHHGYPASRIHELSTTFVEWVKCASDFWRFFDNANSDATEEPLTILIDPREIWLGKALFDLGLNRFMNDYDLDLVAKIANRQRVIMTQKADLTWQAIVEFVKQFSLNYSGMEKQNMPTLIGCMAKIPGETPHDVALYQTMMVNTVKNLVSG
ncbi:MAG: hypothetical protein Q4C83_01880 [Candidatus Saccharibacteria bacterium]|nr:hypothetical protein [Candidatus Saccharibacteria bacterium]